MLNIIYFLSAPTMLGLSYLVNKLNKNETESTLIKFDPNGMDCKLCYKEAKSLCNKTDCAFLKYDYLSSIIRGAKRKVDLCVPLCTMSYQHSPFYNAAKKGIEVRAIFDERLIREGAGGRGAMKSLNEAGGSVRTNKGQEKIMHHKFIIVDDEKLIICTHSWTIGAFFGNFENTEITNDKNAVNAFATEFNYLWKLFE